MIAIRSTFGKRRVEAYDQPTFSKMRLDRWLRSYSNELETPILPFLRKVRNSTEPDHRGSELKPSPEKKIHLVSLGEIMFASSLDHMLGGEAWHCLLHFLKLFARRCNGTEIRLYGHSTVL